MTLLYFIKKDKNWNVPVRGSALHHAAYHDLHWLVRMYIAEDRRSIDRMTGQQDIPLIWASEMGSTESVLALLEAHSEPNAFEADGWSALHWAARKGRTDVARLLLRFGADHTHEDDFGYTPLDWAN